MEKSKQEKQKATVGTFTLTFGALSDKVSDQIRRQIHPNVVPTVDQLGLMDELAENIVRLHVHGVLTDSTARIARRNLMRKVVNCIKIASKRRTP